MPHTHAASPDVVRVTGLVKRYRELVALDHLDLAVRQGEISGFLAPTARARPRPSTASCSCSPTTRAPSSSFGEDHAPVRYDLKRAHRRGAAERGRVRGAHRAREHRLLLRALRGRPRAGAASSWTRPSRSSAWRTTRSSARGKLSGGLLRRLNIACGIAHKPELIFFDEPTVAVDPQSRNAILEGICRLCDAGVDHGVHEPLHGGGGGHLHAHHDHGPRARRWPRARTTSSRRMIGLGRAASRAEVGDACADEARSSRPARAAGARALGGLACERDDAGSLTCGRRRAQRGRRAGRAGGARRGAWGACASEPPTLNDVFLELTRPRALRD